MQGLVFIGLEMVDDDYEWYLKEDLSRYAGTWIAIIDKKVVASGRDVHKVVEEVKKAYPDKNPLITKVKG